ncbi:hypothetical protein [Pseudolactococcus insecticola]|uniref:Uncharacterized protein n=1 Tax=Pseudolactococcus insecticola TaxID=2709158 RepID=A0A6A0B3I5_9LACT|nr:hypothetical protein [Lactococcus insecticola]GFH39899.1 hypothetical protein Hs20B_02970 [Lactococcus insecticola]
MFGLYYYDNGQRNFVVMNVPMEALILPRIKMYLDNHQIAYGDIKEISRTDNEVRYSFDESDNFFLQTFEEK